MKNGINIVPTFHQENSEIKNRKKVLILQCINLLGILYIVLTTICTLYKEYLQHIQYSRTTICTVGNIVLKLVPDVVSHTQILHHMYLKCLERYPVIIAVHKMFYLFSMF